MRGERAIRGVTVKERDKNYTKTERDEREKGGIERRKRGKERGKGLREGRTGRKG